MRVKGGQLVYECMKAHAEVEVAVTVMPAVASSVVKVRELGGWQVSWVESRAAR